MTNKSATHLRNGFRTMVSALLFTLLLTTGPLACGVHQERKNAGKTAIRVGYLPMVSSLTYFVAIEKGYFNIETTALDARPIKTSNLIAQDLISGELDVAIELSIIPLLKASEGNTPKYSIFSTSLITAENGFDGVLALPQTETPDLRSLSGKLVGVFPGSTAKATFANVFSKLYPEVQLPRFIEVDPSLHLQTLASGDVDAIHTYEPTLTTGIVDRGYKKVSDSIYALQLSPSPIGVASLNSQWAKANPESARAIVGALDRAVQFIASNPDEARKILAKYTGSPDTLAAKINIMPMSVSTQIDRANLRQYLEVLREMGEIKQTPNLDDVLFTN